MSSPELRKFGEKLHALRTGEEMTLMALATTLGMCTHSYLSELEAGKKVPTAAIILGVARTFGVSADVLMKDELPLPKAKRKR